MRRDQFYTPPDIARSMVQHVCESKQDVIADFAAGDGQLLKAAEGRWPLSRIVATDICEDTVQRLQIEQPTWFTGQCDFLDPTQRMACTALEGLLGQASLVLLNPPFSCRGGTLWNCWLEGKHIRCGLALAFLIAAIPYLRRNGEIVAIVPKGCLTNEKDRNAREAITSFGAWSVLAANAHNMFAGCSAHTALVRLSLGQSITRVHTFQTTQINSCTQRLYSVRICRGRLSMHLVRENISPSNIRFVHSTHLRPDGIDFSEPSMNEKVFSIPGPSVLLPRVGRQNPSKIHIYGDPTPLALSDCIIAIKCQTIEDARSVRNLILTNWEHFVGSYGGTCAQHLTLKTLSQFLMHYGLSVTIE